MADVADLIGQTFSGYLIERKLGEGGMGVVYLALDVQLKRRAVLKFVSHSASPDPQRRARLLREAQAAAALNHPNICSIYATGEANGQLFIAMEYLDGTDLHALIRQGPTEWSRAVSICSQAAAALTEAHSRGVIHRDIKGGNIFLTRQGVVKLLDFGLAGNRADEDSTKTLVLGGTTAFMSPERIERGIADERTDLWALGVVLYQLLTGGFPFGQADRPSIGAILHDPLVPVSRFIPGVPAGLDEVVGHCLEKRPEARYQTALELKVDLDLLLGHPAEATRTIPSGSRLAAMIAASAAPASAAVATVAVLPFVNLSADPENDFICDGLAEELINGLTQIAGLAVVSRSSSFLFKGTNPDAREAGRKLGAAYIVQGSLRRSGDLLRLVAHLDESASGYQVWSRRFESTMKDLFELEDELSAALLQELGLRLGVSAAAAASRVAPDPESYLLFLRAKHFHNQHTSAGLRQALDLLARSLELEPRQAEAYFAVASCHTSLDWYGLEPSSEAVPLIKRALEAGLALAPESVTGLGLRATVQAGYDWNWLGAEQGFQKAFARGDGVAELWFHYALDLLTPLGRLDEALAAIRKALVLDPLSAITNTALGGCLYRLRRWPEAADSLRSTLEMNPHFAHAQLSLGRVLLEQGRGDEALHEFAQAAQLTDRSPAALADLGYAHARLGNADEARAVLAELEQKVKEGQRIGPMSLALIHAGLGDAPRALAHLDEALAQRSRQLLWAGVDPRFDALHGDPGFQQVLAACGLEPAATLRGGGGH